MRRRGPNEQTTSTPLGRLCAARGLSLRQLAQQLGVHESVVWQWAHGRRQVPATRLAALTAALGEAPPSAGAPRPVAWAERAGTCLDGDRCPRWRCRRCGCYWLGPRSDHRCDLGRVA